MFGLKTYYKRGPHHLVMLTKQASCFRFYVLLIILVCCAPKMFLLAPDSEECYCRKPNLNPRSLLSQQKFMSIYKKVTVSKQPGVYMYSDY